MRHHQARDMEPHWRGVIAEWQASGLTIEAFCRQRKKAPSQFYIWKKKIEEKDGVQLKSLTPRQRMAARAKAIVVNASDSASVSHEGVEFAEVKVVDTVPTSVPQPNEENAVVLEISFASGTQLKIRKGCAPELLEAVVTLLEVR